MASPPAPGGPPPESGAYRDSTFTAYTAAQADAYARNRGSYAANIYEYVFEYFVSGSDGKGSGDGNGSGNGSGHGYGNGQGQPPNRPRADLVLDVGCGPGTATGKMAAFFARAIGVDPSAEMVAAAGRQGLVSAGGRPVEFAVGGAERLAEAAATMGVGGGQVDLITCAMSAHWFDMLPFYKAAAHLLRPEGCLAMWTCSSLYIDQRTTPKAAEVQSVLSYFEDVVLGPYAVEGNLISAGKYETLPMPWNFQDASLSEVFPEARSTRRVWNENGQIEEGKDEYFCGTSEATLDGLAQSLGTASMVTRWREANPEAAGGGKDCVQILIEDIMKVLGLNSEDKRKFKLRTGSATALVMLRRA